MRGNQNRNIWTSMDDVWTHRELVLSMLKRELKIRYSQTIMGFFWAILRPLVYLGIYTFFFTVMSWAYFLDIVNSAGESIVNAAQIIKKTYFPIIVLPVYKSLLGLIELGISFIIFFIIQLILGHPFQWTIVFVPIVILFNFIIGFSLALWTSQLSVRVRDFGHFIKAFINFGFWLTPVFYTPKLIPEVYRFWIYFNPMAGVIEAYRWLMLGVEMPDVKYLFGILIGLIILFTGWNRFAKVEKEFVDYL